MSLELRGRSDASLSAAFVPALPLLATVTATGALTKGKTQPVDASAAAVTMTALPALSGLTVGDAYGLQKTDSSGNAVTAPFTAGDTSLGGATSITLNKPGVVTVQVVAAPTGGGKLWRVLNHVRSDATIDAAIANARPARPDYLVIYVLMRIQRVGDVNTYLFPSSGRPYEPGRLWVIVRNLWTTPIRVGYGATRDNGPVSKPSDAEFISNGSIGPGQEILLGADDRRLFVRPVTSGDALDAEVYAAIAVRLF